MTSAKSVILTAIYNKGIEQVRAQAEDFKAMVNELKKMNTEKG